MRLFHYSAILEWIPFHRDDDGRVPGHGQVGHHLPAVALRPVHDDGGERIAAVGAANYRERLVEGNAGSLRGIKEGGVLIEQDF